MGVHTLAAASKYITFKTFAKWSFAEKAVLFRQGLCRIL